MVSFDFGLKPEEAIAYLQGKGFRLTFDHDEMLREAHHRAFTVAKVTRADLLADIYASLLEAMEKGERFETWKAKLEPTLQQKGWLGEVQAVNPKTGEVRDIHVGSTRLKNIFYTNMRTAYAVARHRQMQTLTRSVYWRYVSALLETTRPLHRQKHGEIRHRDDPWWDTNYPPNGWGCKCKVRAYSQNEIEKKGWVTSEGGIDIAEEGWDYDVGAGHTLAKLRPLDLDQSLESLPESTGLERKIYDALDEDALHRRFYDDLGIRPGETYIDVIGDPMVIDDGLFSGGLKTRKRDRHRYLDLFAQTLSDPDEIWLEAEYHKKEKRVRFVKKMMTYFKKPTGTKQAVMAVFAYEKDKTQGVTLHRVDSGKAVETRRGSKLVYQKNHEVGGED